MLQNENPLILIVDDNPQNVQVLGSILEQEKYEIAIAMNGKDALSFVEKELPDLILLDIMMPELDGYQVCSNLKNDKRTNDLPVIFLTAKRDIEDLVKGFEVGAVDYVAKPFQPEELLARVKAHVELKRAREEIKVLKGIIPICSNCKKVRNDEGFWQQVESYISTHSDAEFSHGLCPECMKKLYPQFSK